MRSITSAWLPEKVSARNVSGAGEGEKLIAHQKVCPMLKKTLKWLACWGSKMVRTVDLEPFSEPETRADSNCTRNRSAPGQPESCNARRCRWHAKCSCSRTGSRWPAAGKDSGFFWLQCSRLWNMSCPLVKTFPASWKMAKLMLSWKKGKVGGGVRSSILFMNSAVPPRGNPVAGSRGPA